MAYDNTNRGALFKETEKKNEKGPDYTGTLDVNGTAYRLAAWVKEGTRGKFFSLNVQPKDDAKPAAKPAKAMDDSDLPF